jgi:hypothetical protein
VVTAALVGAALGALGTFLTWYTITIGDVTAPGGSANGLDGRDGQTLLGAAAVAVVAAVLVVIGRRRVAAKVGLLAAGTITVVVAVAGLVDATSKDEEVEEEFGIPTDRVDAELGPGLWVVAAGGVALVVAGALVAIPDDGGSAQPLAPGSARATSVGGR